MRTWCFGMCRRRTKRVWRSDPVASQRSADRRGFPRRSALRRRERRSEVVDMPCVATPTDRIVWFDPVGLLIQPGQTVRWTNKDAGNSHTATAYHPANDGHPLRIPAGAEALEFRLSIAGSILLGRPYGARRLRFLLHPARARRDGRSDHRGRRISAGASAIAGGIPEIAEKDIPKVTNLTCRLWT